MYVLSYLEKAGSCERSDILAVFKEPEIYDSLKNASADIIEEVERLQKIEVGDIISDLDYYLGGDWKFLAMVTGIDSASCAYWCNCKTDPPTSSDQ